MEQKISKDDKSGGLETGVMPPPPRKRGRQSKVLLASIAGLVVIAAGVFYYRDFILPYESTDDAFIDGYVPLISSRVPGRVAHLVITDNQEVKEGDLVPRCFRWN